MLSKNQISFVTSLHRKKFRKEEQMFIVEGEKVVTDLFSSSLIVRSVFATHAFIQKHEGRRKQSSMEWIEVTHEELKKISALTTPNEVLAVVEIPEHHLEKGELKNSLSFVLDDVSDPGNLGTIIRIADWFGIRNIICSLDTTDCYNPKSAQASMGSLFRVNLHYTDLNRFFDENNEGIKNPVYGASLKGEVIYESELSANGYILLGSESKGLNESLKKYVTRFLYIPSFAFNGSNSSPDSLNVAVAGAIVCSEFRRRGFRNSEK